MDYDPKNPQHPLDKWWERNKRKFVLLPFIAGAGFMWFYAALFRIAYGILPNWILLGGTLCLVILILTFAEMMQGYFINTDDD